MPKLPIVEIDPEEIAREIGQAAADLYMKGGRKDDPGITIKEYAQLKGLSISTAKRQITRLKKADKLIIGARWAQARSDRCVTGYTWTKVPVYRLKKDEKKGGET